MWCVLAHCLGVEGLTWQERQKIVSCSGSFFYPELAGRRGRRPAGWQPALADVGVDFSGLPTDRPVNFDDIEAFELRNAGWVEVFVFVWQQTLWTDGLEYPEKSSSSAPRAARPCCFSCTAAIHNFQALAGRQGLTLGATPTNAGGCKEYKCPRCMPASPRRPRGSATAPPSASALGKCRCPGPRRACCATGARPPQSSRP